MQQQVSLREQACHFIDRDEPMSLNVDPKRIGPPASLRPGSPSEGVNPNAPERCRRPPRHLHDGLAFARPMQALGNAENGNLERAALALLPDTVRALANIRPHYK